MSQCKPDNWECKPECRPDRCDCKEELEDIKKVLNGICCQLNRIAEALEKKHRCC